MTRTERFEKSAKPLLKLIEKDWGPRCETWDYEDFPELKGQTESRCPVCIVYEYWDKMWAQLDLEPIKNEAVSH